MATVASISVDLNADTARFQKRMQAAEARLQSFKRRAEEAGRRMATLGKKMSLFFTLPAVVAGGLALRSFAQYEVALNEVAKNANFTDAQLSGLSDTLDTMSIALGQSNTALAGVSAEIARMGIHGRKSIERLTEVLAKLSKTSDIIASSAQQDFAKLAGIVEVPAEKMENLASVVTMLGQRTKAGEAAIVEMARDLAASTKLYEMAGEDVLAFAAAARDLGLRVRGTGRAFNRTLRRIAVYSSAANEGSKATLRLERTMGMTRKEINRLVKSNPADALLALLRGLHSITGEADVLTDTLEDLNLNTDRTRQILELMAKKADQVGQSLKDSRKEFKAPMELMNEWNRHITTFMHTWDQMTNQIRVTAQHWAEDLVPTMKGVIGAFKGLFVIIDSIPGPLRKVVLGFVGLAATVGPLLFVTGKLVALYGRWLAKLPRVLEGIRKIFIAQSRLGALGRVSGAFGFGWAVGSLLRQIPAVKGAMDQLFSSMLRVHKQQEQFAETQKKVDKAVAKSAQKAFSRLKQMSDGKEQQKLLKLFFQLDDAFASLSEKQQKYLIRLKFINDQERIGKELLQRWANIYGTLKEAQESALETHKANTPIARLLLEQANKRKKVITDIRKLLDIESKLRGTHIFMPDTLKGIQGLLETLPESSERVRKMQELVNNQLEVEEAERQNIAARILKQVEHTNSLKDITEARYKLSQLELQNEEWRVKLANRVKEIRAEEVNKLIKGVKEQNKMNDIAEKYGDQYANIFPKLVKIQEKMKRIREIFAKMGKDVPKGIKAGFDEMINDLFASLDTVKSKMPTTRPAAFEKGTVEEVSARLSGFGKDKIQTEQLKENKKQTDIQKLILRESRKSATMEAFTF